MAKFRVRFAPDRFTPKQLPQEALKPRKQAPPRRFYRCRYPCRECRQSRSRCDETYPVCLRCSRKGIVCHAAAREQQWQIHLPALTLISGHHVSSLLHSQSDNQLLQYWLEKTSRILVACDDENPFAYPIIEHLSTSQSMLHIIKSISSAHQHFFHPGQVHDSLEQRIKAIEALRGELGMGSQQLHTLFLSIYLLGISSSFLDHELQDFGHEHLEAARIVIDLILAEEASRKHPLTRLAVGTFVYWDMSCAFLTPTSSNPTPNFEGLLYTFIVEEMTGVLHPTTGPCTELFYILCTLGRYIRHVISGGIQDLDLEILLETKLLNWNLPDPEPSTMWVQTAEAFRKHGLIMLCRFSYAPSLVPWETWTDTDEQSVVRNINQLTRQYAVDIMASLSTIPLTSTYLALQPIPLLTAGAELTVEDSHLRRESKSRLLALYSCSRIPANLVAANLLDRLWQLRMEGGCVTWPELLIQDNMKLRVG
ncbi:hypothetical protein BHE90_002285 [Fusarium euwallaceae]|uniref:Zn(2)-C6 fungal-type domain-containing protein n=2 Tax=Fusarium solani species complex TaxID=232080 RepID=A0A3M2RRG1_9HYPO|nr:hypothetical protein CDV36_012483 [Fusarium kuroshium]RTE83201.1 hypothetical protein BHE90_002285 [Fusarium euwallaceae]